MKLVLLVAFVVVLLVCPSAYAAPTPLSRFAGEIQLVAQLPAELPQRISSLAYDGNKFWVAIYHDRGRYATLDPATLHWKVSHEDVIGLVSGKFSSPGGICFVDGKLWVGGSYGDSFGAIDPTRWTVERVFRVKQREHDASQSYSGLAYDGNHLWIAWHWFNYHLPVSQTQLLLKVEPATGKVVEQYPAPPGAASDGTHGLTWDGTRLWHLKGNKLSAVEPSTGLVTSEYILKEIKRASGLAWDGQALWIAEFDGKVWRLPI
jgi:streptogramin lyase